MNNTEYTIKSYKHVAGHDGHGFTATLHRVTDGKSKKVATIFDDGWGGPIQIDFINPKSGELHFESAEFHAWCKAQPASEFEGTTLEMDADLWIGLETQRMNELEQIKKHSRTKILFQLKDTPRGHWGDVKRHFKLSDKERSAQWEAMIVKKLQTKFGDEIRCIAGMRNMEMVGTPVDW